ncbi:MAG: hypothetical protein AB7I04_18315 [Pseudomonadales bacterium]
MKPGEHITAYAGIVTFGTELMLAAEQIQAVEMTDQGGGEWRLEVKSAQRAAPFYPYQGTEVCTRKRYRELVQALRDERERVRRAELQAITTSGVVL